MNIRLNEVTWYTRILTIVFIFGIFPIIVFMVGKKYQETISVLSYGQVAAYELYATGTYNKQSSATSISSTFKTNIEGDWVNEKNSSYKTKIKNNNLFYETYNGKIIESGSWIIRDLLLDTPFANLKKGNYLEKNSLDDEGVKYVGYYQILDLDTEKFNLVDLKRGNTIHLLKDVTVSSSDRSVR